MGKLDTKDSSISIHRLKGLAAVDVTGTSEQVELHTISLHSLKDLAEVNILGTSREQKEPDTRQSSVHSSKDLA